MFSLFVILLLSYLVGSIPTSIIVSKLAQGIDIRQHGSGNAGGTNTFRILGWKAALIVVIVDIAKGAVAALVFAHILIGNDVLPISYRATQFLAGLAAVCGHIWTAFAGFRGGKGVATGAGMLLGTLPGGLLIAVPVFAIVVYLTGYVSLSSILATTMVAIGFIIMDETGIYNFTPLSIWMMIGLAALIIFSHRSNVKRLFDGKENSFKKKTTPVE
jgi:glycerol-3-phosphate acyltransferase PlsY